jgi:hypothetical protein
MTPSLDHRPFPSSSERPSEWADIPIAASERRDRFISAVCRPQGRGPESGPGIRVPGFRRLMASARRYAANRAPTSGLLLGGLPGGAPARPQDVLVLLGVTLLPVAWFLLGLLLARAGGWRYLARFYRAERQFRGGDVVSPVTLIASGLMYPVCAEIGANREGFHLRIPLLRPGHPWLLIPWAQLSVRRRRFWGMDFIELCTERAPGSHWLVSAVAFQRVLDINDPSGEWIRPCGKI